MGFTAFSGSSGLSGAMSCLCLDFPQLGLRVTAVRGTD